MNIYGVAFLKADNRGYADDFKTVIAKDQDDAIRICKEMFNPMAITAVYLELQSFEKDLS